eukprot:1913284-Pyramimonas_sp.AAC.1
MALPTKAPVAQPREAVGPGEGVRRAAVGQGRKLRQRRRPRLRMAPVSAASVLAARRHRGADRLSRASGRRGGRGLG